MEECFIDEGGLQMIVDKLPWGLKRGTFDVSVQQGNAFVAGMLDGLR